jgi:hypothetical protein
MAMRIREMGILAAKRSSGCTAKELDKVNAIGSDAAHYHNGN